MESKWIATSASPDVYLPKEKAPATSGVCAEAKTRSVFGLSKVGVVNEKLSYTRTNEPMTAMSVVSDAHNSQVSLRVNRSIAF